jgi:hypothetical protein
MALDVKGYKEVYLNWLWEETVQEKNKKRFTKGSVPLSVIVKINCTVIIMTFVMMMMMIIIIRMMTMTAELFYSWIY